MVNKAIDTSSDFRTVNGLESREKEVLELVNKKTGFLVEKNIWRSSYWGSKTIGAANYLGDWQGKRAVLKIQGAKPALSEIDVLKTFESQNRSKIVRTAKLFDYIGWSDEDQLEALIMEYVDGPKIIKSKRPTTEAEMDEFLRVYWEYRQNCRNTPWLDKPSKLPSFDQVTSKMAKVREEIYPHHPLRTAIDDQLIDEATEVLNTKITVDNLEFVHGHLSAEDIFRTNISGEYVLFSNLFWNWKHPYYDLVFAYHWLIYNLAEYPETNEELIESQRELWIRKMEQVVSDKKAFRVALLERAVAGLMIDAFAYIDPKNPAALPLIQSTRDQVRLLIDKLR